MAHSTSFSLRPSPRTRNLAVICVNTLGEDSDRSALNRTDNSSKEGAFLRSSADVVIAMQLPKAIRTNSIGVGAPPCPPEDAPGSITTHCSDSLFAIIVKPSVSRISAFI